MGITFSCLTLVKFDKIERENKRRHIQKVPEEYEPFKVYFKGLLTNDHETVETSFGGIGVAICDMDDHCVFEVRKQVTISREKEGDMVELLALIEGLNTAVELGIKRVHILCDNYSVYRYSKQFQVCL
ncbi:IBR domain-containing protein [Artemisia annua]|uniref:IBR domain-containing protein n=1 Tax=Artemisia annua TaxID=35608 RepID=A0A2U1KL65_ARTAN|nr:IBR domain-containing protein [Artemisia annua]